MGPLRELLYVERNPGGSVRALSCALEVALAHGSRLTVAGVVAEPAAGTGAVPGGDLRRAAGVRRWRRRLEELAATCESWRVPAGIRVLEGAPVEAVLEEARSGGYDLVITAADPGGALWPWRLSAVDRGLVRRCPVPLWLLHPAQSAGLRVVLAAVDVGGTEGGWWARGSPADEVVGVAGSLAAGADAELHVVHAWSLVGDAARAGRTRGLSRTRYRRLQADVRRERRQRIEALLRRYGTSAHVTLPKGGPVRGIQGEARRRDADIVVIGIDGRGRKRRLFGGVAERVVGRIPGSVLVVPAPEVSAPDRRGDGGLTVRRTARGVGAGGAGGAGSA
jgi:universal stress protein E